MTPFLSSILFPTIQEKSSHPHPGVYKYMRKQSKRQADVVNAIEKEERKKHRTCPSRHHPLQHIGLLLLFILCVPSNQQPHPSVYNELFLDSRTFGKTRRDDTPPPPTTFCVLLLLLLKLSSIGELVYTRHTYIT